MPIIRPLVHTDDSAQVSPVVHQLDHFQAELSGIADRLIEAKALRYVPQADAKKAALDRAWQAIAASRCLFDCAESMDFAKEAVAGRL